MNSTQRGGSTAYSQHDYDLAAQMRDFIRPQLFRFQAGERTTCVRWHNGAKRLHSYMGESADGNGEEVDEPCSVFDSRFNHNHLIDDCKLAKGCQSISVFLC